MSITAEAIRELHRLHRQATDLRDRLTRGPKQVKAREGNVAHLTNEFEAAKEALTKVKMSVKEKELSLKSREDRILDLQAKKNSCSSNREYQTLLEQIAADEQANSVLSDEILELFDKATDAEKVVELAQAGVKEAEKMLANLKNKVESERAGLQADLDKVESELKDAEKGLPADVKQDYERVVKAHGEDALAPMDDEVCGGCFQKITSQMINELQLSKMVFCKSCGRLLYIPEDTAVR